MINKYLAIDYLWSFSCYSYSYVCYRVRGTTNIVKLRNRGEEGLQKLLIYFTKKEKDEKHKGKLFRESKDKSCLLILHFEAFKKKVKKAICRQKVPGSS